MKRFFLLLLSIFICCLSYSQNQYALLIGINHYAPPAGYIPSTNIGRLDFPNLEGCRNDMDAMYSIIKSEFHFNNNNIDTLIDETATRDGILNAMKNLIAKCKPGDIAFIYYAGHGSQVRNSLSANKADKMDETIVPSDTWKEGVRDIRDKELSKIFNEFIDKKIKLTVIFDCCHSGSISRGPNLRPGKIRFMPAEDWDSKDPSSPLDPAKRAGGNFLIFSAAQADENAGEQQEWVDNGTYVSHGAFTLALIEALQQLPNSVSAEAIFASARGILKNNGATQEPNLEALPERKSETLFGLANGKLIDHSTIAVSGIKNGKVILEGGWALGLHVGNELSLFNETNKNDTIYKLSIEKVLGVTKCEATVIKGDGKKIKPGNLFQVTNWASGGVPLLNIYIPASTYTDDDINKIKQIAINLKRSHKTVWLEDLKKSNPYVSVFFDNHKCYVKIDTGSPKELKNVSAQNILDLCKQDSSLYFEIPASKDSTEVFIHKLQPNHNLNIVNNINQANYCLFGKLGKNNLPAYGFRKVEINTADSLGSMPLFTDCFEFKYNSSKSVADSLAEIAKKLSKLRGWLNIVETPQSTNRSFPFHIEFINVKTNKIIQGKYLIGDSVRAMIVADSDFMHYESSVSRKYVYVFALFQDGRMQLLFPSEENANDGNRFPLYNQDKLVDSIPITDPTVVTLPTGTDNYFMLATDQAIPNPGEVFSQEGVNSDVISRGVCSSDNNKNPLTELLDLGNFNNNGGSVTRALPPKKLQANWSIQKYSYKCTY